MTPRADANADEGPLRNPSLPANGRAGQGTWTEYAVRYDAPADYAGLVAHIRETESIAASMARAENGHPGGDFKCVVVSRIITASEWQTVEETP